MEEALEGFRLSPQQRRLLALQRGGGVPVSWIEAALEGELDPDALRAALARVVECHEALRTTFPILSGMSLPLQVVAPPDFVWDEGGGDAALDFDLARGPLLRARLTAVSPREHRLLLAVPALCCDGLSLFRVLEDLAREYGGTPEDGSAEPPMQAIDFSEWQNDLLGSDEGGDLWRRQSSRGLDDWRLPAETAGAASGASASVEISVEARHAEQAGRLAAEAGAPLPAVFLAVWQALLGRLSGQDRLVVGAAFDGRPYEELARSVGFLARYLPVPCDLGGDESFRDLLAHTGAAWKDTAKWQESFSWERLAQAEGGVPEDTRFHAGFRFDETLPAPQTGNGLRISVVAWQASFEPLPLELCLRHTGGVLTAALGHDPALLLPPEAQRLADQYRTLLTQALAAPDVPLDDLELIPEDERRTLLEDFNATQTTQRSGLLHHLFSEQAERTPDAPAAVSAGRSLSFSELETAANRLAQSLRRRGVGPGALVAVALERSPDLLAALLATLKAGGAYLPLDAAQPRERLARILEAARPRLLITSPRYPGTLPEGLEAAVLDLERDRAEWTVDSPEDQLSRVEPEDLAYVLFTSGSTGTPKGVMVTHGGLANYLAWAEAAYPAVEGRGAPVHSPIGFDLTVTSLFLPLLAGRPAVLLPEEPGLGVLAGALTEGGFGFAKLTPAHLEALAELVPQEALARSTASLILGGEALTGERLRPWRGANPGLRVFNEYGPTETVVGCCVYELPPGDPPLGAVPIGRPIANTRLYVLNRRLRPVPAGVPGELYIGGAGLARGYLGEPALTAERFVPDPFGGLGERLYKTGDRVHHGKDRQLEFRGRFDHQVKIRGHRVEPGEIEAVLAQHPGIRECAVVAQDEKRDGATAGRRLIAYVLAEPGQEARAGELRLFLEERLPSYMVPAVFVPLGVMPLTANGKVDRAALPAPGRGRPELEEAFIRPQGLEEEVLAEIWAGVLGLENVGSNDNFFALGGDSIRSIQVRSEAEKRGLHFTVQQIFQYPTVRTLARELRGEVSETLENAEDAPLAPFALIAEEDRRQPADVEDAYPVAQLQAGMLFHSELLPGSAIYHDIYTFRLRGPLDPLTLRASLQRLAARHEALRTSFDLSGASEPLQRVHRSVEIPLELEDLSALPPAEQEARIAAWQEDEKHRPFDWARPPLLRSHVHRLGEGEFQFSFGFHHAILDGWSVATLLAELFRSYLSLVAGEATPPEPPLAIGYRHFVAAEQRALRSEKTRRYWSDRVGDALRTRLPRRSAMQDSYDQREIQRQIVPFTPQLSEDLKRVARQTGVPLKSVLLASHFRVLSVLTGQTDVATGMVSNGRLEAEGGERMLGLFLNTLPLRQQLSGGMWLDLIRDAFEEERGSLPHRRFPLAELQRMSGGEPIFETVFNFMHFHVYESVSGLRGLEVTGGDAFEEANFPFAANFSVGGPAGVLMLGFDYDARQLDVDQIAFFARVYDRTLHALAADPRARYESSSPLSEEEQLQLLQAGEGEASPAPPSWTVHERLAALAREMPEALAAVFEEEPGRVREIRYGELDARANQLARHLARLGVGRGSLVGLCLRRSPELLDGIFGILKAGAAYLPLDPAYPRERLAQILGDARASVLVTDEPAAARLPGGGPARIVLLDHDRAEIEGESAEPFHLPLCGDDAAYVVYTSGSTGVPKGVVATHGGLANFSQAVIAEAGLAPAQRMLQFASIAFDASGLQIFPTLTSGATLVLHPDPGGLTSREILDLCLRLEVSVLDLPGSLWRQWVETMAQESQPLPESIQVYMTGGERLTGETLRLWAWILPGGGKLLSSYGPTEATITTLFFSILASRVSVDPSSEPPLGRPLSGTRIRLLDAAFQPVPEGVPGELYIGGAGLARGYLHRPDLTAERFLPDPFAGLRGEPGARLYRTGDLARPLPDGGFEFQGRTDQQVKIRGFRVEPGEIEAVLARHPAVREAVVLPREDRPGQKRLVAYLLIDSQIGIAPPEVADLRAHIGRFLPDYMVPSAFLALDELPLLPSGKVDRRALPAADALGLALGSGFVAPRTPVEKILAGIWAKVIGADRVGALDNFFELGGHSLLATQVITRIRQTLEIDLPLRALFESPTLEGLAAVILADPEQRAKVERTAELTLQLAGLSEDEVERMLLAESGLESHPS